MLKPATPEPTLIDSNGPINEVQATPEPQPARHDWQLVKSAVGGGEPAADTFRCSKCHEVCTLGGFETILQASYALTPHGCGDKPAETQPAQHAPPVTRPDGALGPGQDNPVVQPGETPVSLQPLWAEVEALTERLAKVEAVAHAPQSVVAPAEVDALWRFVELVAAGYQWQGLDRMAQVAIDARKEQKR